MADQRVFAARRTSTGELLGHQAKVRGIHFVSSGTAGTIVLRDGGATGSVRLTVDTPAVAEGDTVIIPGYIEFDTDVHVTLTDVDAVTVFWNN